MKQKVLLFDQFGAGSTYSGPGNFFVNLLRANPEKEFHFSLLHGCKQQSKIDVFEKEYTPFVSGGLVRDSLFSFFSLKMLGNINYDIYQSTHCYMSSINAAHYSIKMGKPTFLRVAKSNSELSNRSNLSKILNLSKKKIELINSSSGIVAISSEIEDELISIGVNERKIYKIFNGVNTAKFNITQDNVPEDFFDGSIIIAFCGALIERKCPHLVLDVLKRLPNNYKACFIGPINNKDKYCQYFMREIISNNLSERVLLTGYVSNPENYLKASDFFFLFSKNEGMPNALLEAMACGLYPFSTPISGVKDIIAKQELGIMIEQPDADMVAQQVKNITCTNLKKAKIDISNYIEEKFSAKNTFDKYFEMYGEHL